MAAKRFGFKIDKGLDETWEVEWIVNSGAVGTIAAGTPTKNYGYDASGFSAAAIPMVDGDGYLDAANHNFLGIAKTTSTDTAAAAGVVDIWVPVPGLIYRGSPLVAGAANTQAEVDALMGRRVVFDLTSSKWTVDTAATDALVNCVVICGGIPNTDEVLFMYADKGTFYNTATAVTS